MNALQSSTADNPAAAAAEGIAGLERRRYFPKEWHDFASRDQPARPWKQIRSNIRHRWTIPFRAFEWGWEWVAYGLSRWSFLQALEYLSSLSVLVGVLFYFSESGDRVKQRHYQAWQVINTAQGKGGSGGRIEALEELNSDRISLVGVDVSSASLQGLRLEHANLLRSDFSTTDLRDSDFQSANLTDADLHYANFRGSDLRHVSLAGADLTDSDLVGSDLTGATLDRADLTDSDLRDVNLQDVEWTQVKSVRMANIAAVKNPPRGFVEWAMAHGAVQNAGGDN